MPAIARRLLIAAAAAVFVAWGACLGITALVVLRQPTDPRED